MVTQSQRRVTTRGITKKELVVQAKLNNPELTLIEVAERVGATYGSTRKFWSEYCRQEVTKEGGALIPISKNILDRYQRLKEFWFEGKLKKLNYERRGYKAETELAPKILQCEGFSELLWIGKNFPIDYLAKKNGSTYFIEVTTYISWKLKKSVSKLTDYLDLQGFVLFIKPDFSGRYFLKKLRKKQRACFLSVKDLRRGLLKCLKN